VLRLPPSSTLFPYTTLFRSAIVELRSQLTTKTQSKQRSLAVLPFQSLTSDADNAHLGLALADAVTSELALLRSLVVRPTAAILRDRKSTRLNSSHLVISYAV